MSYTIIIADDHKIIFDGINLLLQAHMPGTSLDNASDLFSLSQKIKEKKYDLLILDIDMPGGSVLEFVKKNVLEKNIPILMLSAYDEQTFATTFIKAGAMGYVGKKEDANHLLEAIQTVLSGKKYVSPKMREYMLELSMRNSGKELDIPASLDMLSDKEMEIARLLALGLPPKEISDKVEISLSSVAVYKNRIFSKLKVDNVIQLAKFINLEKENNLR